MATRNIKEVVGYALDKIQVMKEYGNTETGITIFDIKNLFSWLEVVHFDEMVKTLQTLGYNCIVTEIRNGGKAVIIKWKER